MFCCKDFWSRLYPSTVPDQSNKYNNCLPIRHVIVSLLTVIGSSISDVLNKDLSSAITPCSAPAVQSDLEEVKDVEKDLINKHFVSTVIPLAPSIVVFELIDFLLEFLNKEIISHCDSNKDRFSYISKENSEVNEPNETNTVISNSEWYFHLYFLIWSISTLIRALKSYFILSIKNGVQIGSGDFKSFIDLSSLQFNKLSISLMEKLSDFAGVDNVALENKSSAFNDAMSSFISKPFSEKQIIEISASSANSISDDIDNITKIAFSYSGINLRHNLRLIATDSLVSSFTLFQPDSLKRLNLLEEIINKSPKISYLLLQKGIKSLNLYELLKISMGTNDTVFEFPNEYYQLLFTQKACVTLLCSDDHLNYFDNFTKVHFPITHQPVPLQLDKKNKRRTQIMKFLNSKNYADLNYKLLRIKDILTDRLVEPGHILQNDILYWGELLFLQGIQLSHIDQYIIALDIAAHSSTSSQFSVNFNYNRCHPNLQLSADGKVATHQGPKLWATVTGQKGFEPNTGYYEWLIRIDKCSKGHVFLGVVTADACTDKDSYVGVDRGGWGLIGTRSLWHNKSKVVADYGTGFGTGSFIKVCLDTDRGTLAFQAKDNDWGVAFENIPKQTIFPAFSLHEKDDQISFLFCSKLENKNYLKESKVFRPLEASPKQNKLQQSTIDMVEYSFTNYCQKIFFETNQLLLNFPDNESTNSGKKYITHPLIGTLVSSLAAAIGSFSYNPVFLRKITIQLLPFLTILSKRLSVMCDNIKENIMSSGLDGKWLLRGSTNGLSHTFMEYIINFSSSSDNSVIPLVGSDEFRSSFQPIKLFGKGKNLTADIVEEGTQLGSRIKLLESWDKSEYCIIDGRISLCGQFISGRHKNIKTGKMGFLDGIKIIDAERKEPIDGEVVLMKTALLCANACGKLTINLVVGDPCFTITSTATKDSDKNIVEDPADETLSMVDEPGSNEEVVKEVTNDKQGVEVNSIDQWLKSNLFSGGLNLSDYYEKYLVDNIFQYVSFNSIPISSEYALDNKLILFREKTIAWWLKCVFPSIKDNIENQFESKSHEIDKVDYINQVVKVNSTQEFYHELTNGKGDAQILDDYLSLYSGQSSLVKIGGEPMRKARKSVLISLIKHCGCSRLCLSEAENIVTGRRQNTDRPNNVLLEIWRSVHRVIERIIRMKQESGSSYEDICNLLYQKTELLMELQESKLCSVISDSFQFFEEESGSKEWWLSEVGLDVQQDCFKLLSETVEFLISTIQSVDVIRNQLINCAVATTFRVAGFNSFALLVNKVEYTPYKFPATVSNVLFSAVVENIVQSLKDLNVVNSSNYFDLLNNLSLSGAGHYLDGISGVSNQLVTQLQSSFESVFDAITQHLARCTWAGDRDGQLVSLVAWGGLIKPDDHYFLNRISIFRVLQTVLDDARNSINKFNNRSQIDFNLKSTESGSIDIRVYDKFRSHEQGLFAYEVVLNSHKRLAQLALSIVYGLSWQVACSKEVEDTISKTSASRLRRIQSGPDTLSKSLFDLMYTELFTATKKMITLASKYLNSTNQKDIRSKIESTDDLSKELLEGENYMYRILRLLFLVSTSKSCQSLLCSPKWLSIFFAGITLSSLGIQRRILRLLRRLLLHCDPSKISVYIPSFFSMREEIIDTEEPFDDDDILILISQQGLEVDIDGSSKSCNRLIKFFMEAISVSYPTIGNSKVDTGRNKVLQYLNYKGTTELLSADSLVVLRVLLGIPSWRSLILSNITILLDISNKSLFSANDNSSPDEIFITASLAILGGNIERLRIGGLVSLKPFCLMGSVDNFATKLAAAFHSCGMLVSQASSSSSVEVVLIDRGIKVLKSDKSDSKDLTIHHTINLAANIPIRAIRLASNEISPCADITAVPVLINNELLISIISIIEKVSSPWLKKSIKNRKISNGNSSEELNSSISNEENTRNLDILKVIFNVFAFKSLSLSSQDDKNVQLLIENQRENLLLISALCFGLIHANHCFSGLTGSDNRSS